MVPISSKGRVRAVATSVAVNGRVVSAASASLNSRIAQLSTSASSSEDKLDCVTPGARSASPLALFRVPLLVADREAGMAALAARGVLVRYVYDPPLDDYAGPEFIAPSPPPAAGRWWVRHALPIDPLMADAALPVLRGLHAARGFAAAP